MSEHDKHSPGRTFGHRKGLDDEHASGRDRDVPGGEQTSKRIRPESEKYTGQAPPEDMDGGPSTEGVDFGAEVGPEERARREQELADKDEGF